MVENDTFFQIHSSEQPNLCMEVFKALNQVGRLWLRQCKSKDESGIERQMFGVTSEGKLHPSTKPSSCLFLYINKYLRYQKDCISILHHRKNIFMFNFFDGTIFLLGDVTKVITVRELEEKKEVKLQKNTPSKITKQRWTIRFERDRVLQPASSCMPSDKHPSSPTSTQRPTTEILPPRPPSFGDWGAYPPTTYQQITTRKDFNLYVYIWLKNNMQGEHATDPEKKLYHELVEKYG